MEDPHAALRPIFYDESRRRWSWVLRLGIGALLVSSLAVTLFVVSVMAIPLLPHNSLPHAREIKEAGNVEPKVTQRQLAKRHFAYKVAERKLEKMRKADRELHAAMRKENEPRVRALAFNAATVVAGFYVNWEETSRASLRRNIDEMTHFFPEWLHLTKNGRGFSDGRIPEDKTDVEKFVRTHGLPIIPVINNYVEMKAGSTDSEWNTNAIHQLVSDPQNRMVFIGKLKAIVTAEKWQGINIDFEEVAAEDRDNLTQLMRELYSAFHPAGLFVTQCVQLEEDGFDVTRLALWNDAIIPMLYDQHSPGDENGSGSVAGIDWTQHHLDALFKQVPASKVILGLGNYAYDWTRGDLKAATLTYQGAVVQAKESQDSRDASIARVQIDPKTLNPYYRYFDDEDREHVVWMMDATTAYNQWTVAKPYAPRGYALWYLGSEDPGIWSVLGKTHIAGDPAGAIAGGALNTISYGRQSQVDFEGEGELLKVMAEPADGRRTLAVDPVSHLVTAENYSEYPSSFVVRRSGHQPKSVVLTFDDGPDASWTPQILDILKRYGVKATFFVIGKQAEENPQLVARMWDEGHEIGNHTFFHPNLALKGERRTMLEITSTERIIEAITGHTTTLFRPPYAIDVEPRTGGELQPIIEASKFNFISVGEKNDPQDWNLTARSDAGKTGADRIAESVWTNRDEGNVILLHDGGGDRTATVAALPRIIERLRNAGYKFITVADLRGASRADLFPAISGRDEVLVGVDRYVFEATYLIQRTLFTLFTLSVVLGVSRQLLMTILALIQRRRERRRASGGVGEYGGATSHTPHTPQPYQPCVSVVIAAYNEERVIVRTVRTVLESDYPDLEVIVVDDGSKDSTFAAITAAFADDGRVMCLRKENGGKASALNAGIAEARGEVIVALDADTLFARDTVIRLVRHFADAKVGAVSGNVRVGNANNILTRWQALEYVTSQNFDRRAYDLMNCITVVPGAVGAWRKATLRDVGGYSSDTLAEDTDLTWKIRRAGWLILNDSSALAFTEAPESLRDLARQRFRWAFGTLQNLWKHRSAFGGYGAFGCVALPSLWLYQILFPAISPVMDLAVVLALISGNAPHVLAYYGLMVGVEFLGAVLAVRMDRANPRLLPWLFLQRLVYRQLMYWVILKSLVAAVRGGAVGWNKFDRRGTAQLDDAPADVPTPVSAAH